MTLTRKIVVTGGECTGKTTLAAALATALGTDWAAEYARVHAEHVARPLGAEDVEPIARGQIAVEDDAVAAAAAAGAPVVVLDTDLISTVVYARHYYGACPAWVEEAARTRRGDLYLLCRPDLPWAPDGVRDRPTEREAMEANFAEALREFGAVVSVVAGTGPERLASARRSAERVR